MKRFLIISTTGAILWETDDPQEVWPALKDTDGTGTVFLHVEEHALGAITRMVEEFGSNFGDCVRRRVWRIDRLAKDPHCHYCGGKVNEKTSTIDHCTPKVRGGVDQPSNWALSCWRCNERKGQMTVAEFLESILDVPAFRGIERKTRRSADPVEAETAESRALEMAQV